MEHKSFIEMCLSGESSKEEINDFIECWHTIQTGMSIYKFLGLTREEYARWVENDDALDLIIEAHKNKE